MPRMRRIQVVIDPELDDWLEREAADLGMSKSAVVRACVAERRKGPSFDNGLPALADLAPLFSQVDAVGIDTELYGSLGHRDPRR